MSFDAAQYKRRREQLIETIEHAHGEQGAILLFAGIEGEVDRFSQDKNFYYYTGCHEPGAILMLTTEGASTLFVPRYDGMRARWVASEITADQSHADLYQVDRVVYLGERERGYGFTPFRDEKQLNSFIDEVRQQKGVLYLIDRPEPFSQSYSAQMGALVCKRADRDYKQVTNIAPQVTAMRQKKDSYELEQIRKAITITGYAHRAVRERLDDLRKNGEPLYEHQVQAALEHQFTHYEALHMAFPSIVATGGNATTLHYVENNAMLKLEEMLVVDIGASWNGYAADITRTYSVGGKPSARQKELYNLVLECQQYTAEHARPGVYLNNREQPDNSLHHIAYNFFKQHGVEQFFLHGLGHFMGLDVHDVGNYSEPLGAGDVFTIEPGLYIKDEAIGIRIEDDYLITKDGVECLSSEIPKGLE